MFRFNCKLDRRKTVRVAGVVPIVDVTARIDVPRVVRITAIRGAKANVLSCNLHPMISLFSFICLGIGLAPSRY